jgi:hypothetical protein
MSNDDANTRQRGARATAASWLITGLITPLAAWGGSWIGSHGAAAVQRDQAHEARRIDARAKRTTAYERFFLAINTVAVPIVRAAQRCGEHGCGRAEWERAAGDGSDTLMSAYDQVALYGSYRGYVAAGRLVGSLPALVLYKRELTIPRGEDLSAQFEHAYQEFVQTMCEEVNAEPRPSCSKLKLASPPTLILSKQAAKRREQLPGGVITIYR